MSQDRERIPVYSILVANFRFGSSWTEWLHVGMTVPVDDVLRTTARFWWFGFKGKPNQNRADPQTEPYDRSLNTESYIRMAPNIF